MFKKAAQLIRKQKTATEAFQEASSAAVSPDNKPGRTLDLSGDSAAAQAARALQSVLDGDEATNDAKITAHEEERFEGIRRHFGRSWEHYSSSLAEGSLRLLGEEEASGKSNAFFVFSEDGRYCVKRVDADEARHLLAVLPDYEDYVLANETLLPRFYGLYEVRLDWETVWLMVQGNVLGGRAPVVQRFDLKGSSHGRSASKSELAKGRGCVLKDLDFVSHGCSLSCVSPEVQADWRRWVEILEADARWLASRHLIDYSLLLGFSSCSAEERKKALTHVKRLEVTTASLGDLISASTAGGESLLVYVGIVDCLMPFTFKKRTENFLCRLLISGDISCQPPVAYAERFAAFVRRLEDPEELRLYMQQRQAMAWRPLGSLVGEFGRKDALTLCRRPSAWLSVLSLAGLVVLCRVRKM